MPKMDLKFSVEEIAAILAWHVEQTRPGLKVDAKGIRFEIEPACNSADPREYRPSSTLRVAIVPASE